MNPKFKTSDAITELGVGEALVSMLDEKGIPTIVERTFVRPPGSRLGPATPEERQLVISQSLIGPKYAQTFDRQSAYERLKQMPVPTAPPPVVRDYQGGGYQNPPQYHEQPAPRRRTAEPAEPKPRKAPARRTDSAVEAVTKSVLRSAGSQFGRSLVRGVLGSIFKGR